VETINADSIKIAMRVNQLTSDLVESLGDQPEASLDPRLKRDLDRFEQSDISWYSTCPSTHLMAFLGT
jgi:hypothetical protein